MRAHIEHQPPRLTVPVTDRDHIQGPEDARVTIVEYGDFECPYCGAAHQVMKAIQAEKGAELRFVYRHFPIGTLHPHAEMAAEAAEAAGARGKFWEMHDKLFEHQDALDLYDLRRYAAELGLDLARFETDLETSKYRERIKEDLHGGIRSGVNGTPTFFLNGRRYEGMPDYDSLLEAIEE